MPPVSLPLYPPLLVMLPPFLIATWEPVVWDVDEHHAPTSGQLQALSLGIKAS